MSTIGPAPWWPPVTWPVPSLIFKFDRLITYKVGEMGLDICHQPGPMMAPITWPVPSLIFKFDRLITYWGQRDGTRHLPSAQPHDSPPSQPHSLTATLTLSTFNLISINYANVWLHTLNVVEGFNMNCLKIYSIILSFTCHSLRNFPPLIHIPSYPFMNFQNPASYYFLS